MDIESQIDKIRSQIERLESEMFIAEIGDDFYYTNGRRQAHLNRLMELKEKLRLAENTRRSG